MASPARSALRSRRAVRRILISVAAATGSLVLGVVVLAAASGSMLAEGTQLLGPGTPAASAPVVGIPGAPIPVTMLRLYRAAAAAGCPGLSWTVLAAIGTIESDNGTSTLPGVHAGANRAGAEGPMQFEPATFAHYDEPVPPGGVSPPSPYDAADAVYAADRMLCADGGGDPATVGNAVWDYNHSAAYVSEVLTMASELAGAPSRGIAGTPRGREPAKAPGP